MGIFIFIGLEILATAVLCYAWKRYDRQLRAWEDRQIEKIKRRVRIYKRNLCAKWLAEDGMIAIPRLSDNEDIICLRQL